MTLSRDQRSHLRGVGQALDPILTVGKAGLTDSVVEAVRECFHTRELAKVRFREADPEVRRAAAADLAQRTGSELVHVIGKVALFYRPASEEAKGVDRVLFPARFPSDD